MLKRPAPPATLPPDAPIPSQAPPEVPTSPNSARSIRSDTPQTPNNTAGAPVRFAIRRPPSGSTGPAVSPVPTSGALVDKTQVRLGLSLVPLTLKASLAHLAAICPDNLDSLTAVARNTAKNAQDAADDALLASLDFTKGTSGASRPGSSASQANPSEPVVKRPGTARQRQEEELQKESLTAVNSGGLTSQLAAAASAVTRLTDYAANLLSKERALFLPTVTSALTLAAGTLTRERFPIFAYMRSLAAPRACADAFTFFNLSAVAVGGADGATAAEVIAAVEKHWRMPGALLLDLSVLSHAALTDISNYCRSRGIRMLGYTCNPFYLDGLNSPWSLIDAVCVDLRKDLSTECGCIIAGDTEVVEDMAKRLSYTGARLPPRVLAPYAIQCHAALSHASKHTGTWVSKARDIHTQVSVLAMTFPGVFRLLPCRGASVFVYVKASPRQLAAARDIVAKNGGPFVFERIIACSDPVVEAQVRANEQDSNTTASPFQFEDTEAVHVYAAATPASKDIESVFSWCIGIHNDKYPTSAFVAGLKALLEALPEAVEACPYHGKTADQQQDADEWPEVELGTESTPLNMEDSPASPAPPPADKPDKLRNFRFDKKK